jgi:hypothetical protein
MAQFEREILCILHTDVSERYFRMFSEWHNVLTVSSFQRTNKRNDMGNHLGDVTVVKEYEI